MKKLIILFITFSFFLLASSSVKTPVAVVSPDGNCRVVFSLIDGAANYSVLYKGNAIIEESPLFLDLRPGGQWGTNLNATGKNHRMINDTYDLLVGKSKSATNHCNEVTIELQESIGDKRRVDLIFRAYNDGIAFRYKFPEQKAFTDFEILAEQTEFRFPDNHKCWALQLGSFTTSYEKEFDPVSIADIKENAVVGLPLTIEVQNGPSLAITEANLTDYAGMYLAGSGDEKPKLVSRLSPLPAEEGVCIKASTPHVSPWRVIMIGDRPGDLIESDIILNLNEPLAIKDYSWIRAGKCAWDWWSGKVVDDPSIESGMNNATMKHYIDFAAENGFEYMLIDAGWEARLDERLRDITQCNPDISIPDLVKYANEKKVEVLIWMHWTSVKRQMQEAFALFEQWGVRGVKIDFMDRDDQEMVRFYREMIETAARHHLMIDFHGAYKPTGLRRTYPNVMTREGILGLEYLKWSDRANPEHNVTAPFTRMLAGPMDYTPGGFRNVTKADFQSQRTNPMAPTTRCHQLAMFVVFESPLQMVADAPANYRNQAGLDFLQKVPASWEETRVITGKIGDYIAIARRVGTTWFIGAMTDDHERVLDLPLSFLGDGNYHVTVWSDGSGAEQDPSQVHKWERVVTNRDTLRAVMTGGGGFAACLRLNTHSDQQ
jgi:alpha-glucosidase